MIQKNRIKSNVWQNEFVKIEWIRREKIGTKTTIKANETHAINKREFLCRCCFMPLGSWYDVTVFLYTKTKMKSLQISQARWVWAKQEKRKKIKRINPTQSKL